MPFLDILRLALRNLREAKLRASLTTMGVVVGVSVIVTMVSFGLGLQRNLVERFSELDLFNEITVYGRSVSVLVTQELNRRAGGEGGEGKPDDGGGGRRRTSERTLDDAALEEIARMPGVAYIEPNVTFRAYVRAGGGTLQVSIGGARIPNAASRFQKFSAGRMISSPEAGEAVVDSEFLRLYGIKTPEEAVGQTVELLAPPEEREGEGDDAGGDELSFFGIPLEEPEGEGDAKEEEEKAAGSQLVAETFKIAGVLQDEVETKGGVEGGGKRFRGVMPESRVYVPLAVARKWSVRSRNSLDAVALALARESGIIGEGESEGYGAATVRVTDPSVAADVVKRLKDAGFNAFSLLDELDEIRTVFLIINSALGLLGGISLLVASFGIANTMIMSIFERTREIGIMKAIGADDLDIKLIFFVEAAAIGFAGGSIGAVLAWGIDKLANQLAFKFLLEPRGASFIDFFSIPPWLWLGAILFAMLISVLAALYPAARAARIDPVRALRHD